MARCGTCWIRTQRSERGQNGSPEKRPVWARQQVNGQDIGADGVLSRIFGIGGGRAGQSCTRAGCAGVRGWRSKKIGHADLVPALATELV